MVKRNMKNKRAFTVVEILLTMSVLGFIILMTTLNAKKQMPDLDKARYKKAYSVVEQTVSTLLNDGQLYPSVFTGFKDTGSAVTDFNEYIGKVANKKFSDAFKYVVNPIKEDMECRCLSGSCECFMTDDGIVYGIPDTDFVSENLQENEYEAGDGNNSNYLPITIYTNWEKVKDDNAAQEREMMFIGVQYDGNIRIFYPNKCNEGNEHRYCKAENYLMSDTIKRDD